MLTLSRKQEQESISNLCDSYLSQGPDFIPSADEPKTDQFIVVHRVFPLIFARPDHQTQDVISGRPSGGKLLLTRRNKITHERAKLLPGLFYCLEPIIASVSILTALSHYDAPSAWQLVRPLW